MTDTVTFAVLGYVGILMIIGALLGLSRGIGRQIVRTITVLTAAVLSIVLTGIASSKVLDMLTAMPTADLIGLIERTGVTISGTDYETILYSLEPDTLSYVLALPMAIVILPIAFIILFAIIKLLMIIVHKIISGICGFSKRRNNFLTRLLGALLGAVQGLAVAIIFTAPLTGGCVIAGEAVDVIRAEAESEEGAAGIVEYYDANIAQYTENFAVKAMGNLGGRLIYEQLANVKLGTETYNIAKEFSAAAPDVSIALAKLGGMDMTAPVSNNKEGLGELVAAMANTPYTKELSLRVLSGLSEAHAQGALNLVEEELLAEVIDAMFEVMGSINSTTFERDLGDLIDAYYILGREGALSVFMGGELEQVRDALTKTYVRDPLDPSTPSDELGTSVSVLTKVNEILGTNEHTRPIVTALSKISLSVLAANLGSDMAIDEIYTNVKNGLTHTLGISKEGKSEEKYKAEVRASIDSAMKSSEINFREDEQYILDNMTDYVYDNYDRLVTTDENGDVAVSDQQINDVILSYYEAYVAGEK